MTFGIFGILCRIDTLKQSPPPPIFSHVAYHLPLSSSLLLLSSVAVNPPVSRRRRCCLWWTYSVFLAVVVVRDELTRFSLFPSLLSTTNSAVSPRRTWRTHSFFIFTVVICDELSCFPLSHAANLLFFHLRHCYLRRIRPFLLIVLVVICAELTRFPSSPSLSSMLKVLILPHRSPPRPTHLFPSSPRPDSFAFCVVVV
jgi:hypothetical protein